MDHHVQSAITAGLRRRGVDVLIAYEDGYAEVDDEQVLERATGLGRLLHTNDTDFLVIADRWRRNGRSFAGIVYGPQQGLPIGKVIEDLETIVRIMSAEEMRDQVQYLPL
jgi:hypothetical protein